MHSCIRIVLSFCFIPNNHSFYRHCNGEDEACAIAMDALNGPTVLLTKIVLFVDDDEEAVLKFGVFPHFCGSRCEVST